MGCGSALRRFVHISWSMSSITFSTSRSLLWYLRMLTVTTGATRSSRTGASGPGPVSPVRSYLSSGTGSGSRIPAVLAPVSGPCSVVRDVVERGASESASVNICWSGHRTSNKAKRFQTHPKRLEPVQAECLQQVAIRVVGRGAFRNRTPSIVANRGIRFNVQLYVRRLSSNVVRVFLPGNLEGPDSGYNRICALPGYH